MGDGIKIDGNSDLLDPSRLRVVPSTRFRVLEQKDAAAFEKEMARLNPSERHRLTLTTLRTIIQDFESPQRNNIEALFEWENAAGPFSMFRVIEKYNAHDSLTSGYRALYLAWRECLSGGEQSLSRSLELVKQAYRYALQTADEREKGELLKSVFRLWTNVASAIPLDARSSEDRGLHELSQVRVLCKQLRPGAYLGWRRLEVEAGVTHALLLHQRGRVKDAEKLLGEVELNFPESRSEIGTLRDTFSHKMPLLGRTLAATKEALNSNYSFLEFQKAALLDLLRVAARKQLHKLDTPALLTRDTTDRATRAARAFRTGVSAVPDEHVLANLGQFASVFVGGPKNPDRFACNFRLQTKVGEYFVPGMRDLLGLKSNAPAAEVVDAFVANSTRLPELYAAHRENHLPSALGTHPTEQFSSRWDDFGLKPMSPASQTLKVAIDYLRSNRREANALSYIARTHIDTNPSLMTELSSVHNEMIGRAEALLDRGEYVEALSLISSATKLMTHLQLVDSPSRPSWYGHDITLDQTLALLLLRGTDGRSSLIDYGTGRGDLLSYLSRASKKVLGTKFYGVGYDTMEYFTSGAFRELVWPVIDIYKLNRSPLENVRSDTRMVMSWPFSGIPWPNDWVLEAHMKFTGSRSFLIPGAYFGRKGQGATQQNLGDFFRHASAKGWDPEFVIPGAFPVPNQDWLNFALFGLRRKAVP